MLSFAIVSTLQKPCHRSAVWCGVGECSFPVPTSGSAALCVTATGHGTGYTKVINSLAPGRSECDSKNGIFNLVLLIGIFRSSHDNGLQWMPQDLTHDKSTLVQVVAWCRQATSHHLSQRWLSSLSPYGVARPQWVNPIPHLNSLPAKFFRRNLNMYLQFILYLHNEWTLLRSLLI